MPSRVYPTVAETIEAQRWLIDEFGGNHGIRDMGLLESAVLRPQSGYYTGLVDETAALMESLAINHPFLDGNKRISLVMGDAMLRCNGYFLDVEPMAAYQFITVALSKNQFRFALIKEWLLSMAKPLSNDEE